MGDVARWAGAAVACLLTPVAAFLAGVLVGDALADFSEFRPGQDGWYAGILLYFGMFFVGPTCFPLAMARTWRGRVAVTSILSIVSAWVGVQVMVTDDAQAGLAVLVVPMVAAAMVVVLLLLAVVRSFRRTPS